MNSQAKIEAGASLLAALPIACVIVAPLRGDHGRVIDCTIVSVNAFAAEFLGHAPEALEGRRVRALCPRLAAEAEFRRLAAVIEACRPARFDAISDIGPHRALDVRAAPFESGAVVVFAGSDEQVAPLAQRLELALETARIGVWELWPDEYRTTWSAEECAIMGVDPADVTGTPDDFRARVAAESVDLVDRAYATLANRDDYRNTCRIIRPDGGARWIREHARVLRRDAKGAPLHVLGVSQDITEEHSALLRAEQAEHRLELAVEAGGVGVWELWPAERKAMWSRVKCAVLGLDPRRYADRIVHLSELPVGGKDAFVEKMTHALREADEMRDVSPAFLPDGGQRWILAHARVMARGPDGAPLHILGVSQDVTEEKEAQLLVERAERRLRAAIEALPDAFALFDAEDRLVVCNQRYRDVYPLVGDAVTPGARFEDILREGLARGQFPNAVGREEAWLAKRLAAHQSGVEAVGQKLADGRWLRIVEGRTDNGDHVGFRVDITELKAAQQRAETAEARLTAALEAMPFGFVIYDPDGRLAMCNAQYRALSPEAAETMVEGVEYAEILRVGIARGEYPELDCAPEDWIAEKLRRLRESGDHVERRSGDRWVRCIAAQSATGDHVGFRVDLTDLKRHERALEHARDEIAARERELQDFFDLSPDLLGVATTEGRFVKLNAAWTAVLGYPTTALIGRSFLDFVHPEDLEATRREAEKAAAGGRSTDFTNRYRHADGGWVWIEWRSAPGPDGLTHFAARDVSERMRAAARREARACQEAVLTETMALALKPTDGENFLRAALDLLIARTPWMRLDDQAAVFLDDATQEEARCLRLAVSRNLDPAIQSYCARVAFGACSCGRAAQTGEAQHVAAPGCGADAGSTEARGAYCVPILNDGALIGVLLVRLRKGDAHDPEALAYLKRVAGVLALGLNQRKLMDETQAARRRAEDALAELSTYQAALDAHAIISVTDTEGVITAVNQRFCEITGYSEAELLGQTHRIVNSGLHPRDHWEKVWRTIKSGAPWHGEVCSRARNGDLYWCDTTLIPVRDADGVIQRFVAIRFDVTDRRRMARELEEINAQLREVAEISGVGGWSLDLKTYTMRWDAITRAINEVPEDYAPEPMSALHFAAPEARPKMQAAARACFEQGEPFDMELPVITAKGREIWVRSGARPVFEDGRVVRIDGVVQDITERKLREIEATPDNFDSACARFAG